MALLNIHQGICVNNKYYIVKFPHLRCSGVDSVEAGAVSPGLAWPVVTNHAVTKAGPIILNQPRGNILILKSFRIRGLLKITRLR